MNKQEYMEEEFPDEEWNRHEQRETAKEERAEHRAKIYGKLKSGAKSFFSKTGAGAQKLGRKSYELAERGVSEYKKRQDIDYQIARAEKESVLAQKRAVLARYQRQAKQEGYGGSYGLGNLGGFNQNLSTQGSFRLPTTNINAPLGNIPRPAGLSFGFGQQSTAKPIKRHIKRKKYKKIRVRVRYKPHKHRVKYKPHKQRPRYKYVTRQVKPKRRSYKRHYGTKRQRTPQRQQGFGGIGFGTIRPL